MTVGAKRHGRSVALLFGLVGAAFAFGFALVPLYGLICEVTGIQSLPGGRVAATAPVADGEPSERMVTVRFDTNVQGDLPWEFRPVVRSMQVRIGEMYRADFVAHNRSGATVAGQAVPAVTPWQATSHFNKTECFCFKRQVLGPGESQEMPLAFRISPALPAGIETLTLSYSFMRAPSEAGS